jgi:hypothetical protein
MSHRALQALRGEKWVHQIVAVTSRPVHNRRPTTKPTGNELYLCLKQARPEVHLLGDAYASRRMMFARRQAWHLASVLD